MTENPLVVRPETNLAAAAKVLLDQKVRRLPVVDDRGRLLGIFTRCGLLPALTKLFPMFASVAPLNKQWSFCLF